MNFDKHSNFNPKANFSEVKFGENMPVLEVELNELQQIQNEARADIIRDSIPSGFVTLGEIDYEYCKSNNNQIKLKTESIAYVNGYRITIPKDTIIEIGESDKVREDLVFLEVWKEVVTDESDLKEYGGEQNASIENPIKDERYPIATSQRVALKYRIRHVAEVDFNTNYDGLEYQALSNGTNNPSKAKPQGGNDAPLTTTAYDLNFFRGHLIPPKNKEVPNRTQFTNDLGLYVAGVGETSKSQLKTLDGYVYAIPMFRLKRKPNVGLASPFEYKKIHTQIDPKKFAHLVNQENVEKVHSVDVVGKTYTNLLTYASVHNNGSATNVNVSPEKVTFNSPNSWGKVGFFVRGEPNTKYIFHCADFYASASTKVFFYVRFQFDLSVASGTLDTIDANTYTFTTDSSGLIMFTFETTAGVTGAYVDSPILMKYDEWNDELRGKTIVGMQSLGQEQNNSITIENNLVKEGTYVPELQNNILPTYPEVTHVTWGDDVVIPPELEIEVKRGEELLQTITQLPVKLETTGDEKLHVKSMKGQTLVNLAPKYDGKRTTFYSVDGSGFTQEYTKDYYKITANDSNCNVALRLYLNETWQTNQSLKLNTTYLAIVDLDVQVSKTISLMCGKLSYSGIYGKVSIPNNGRQRIKLKFTTPSEINESICIGTDLYSSIGDYVTFYSIVIVEYKEDIENLNIPYFEGMKSVVAPSVKITGKNLFNGKLQSGRYTLNEGVWFSDSNTVCSINKTKVKPNTQYTLTISDNAKLYNISEYCNDSYIGCIRNVSSVVSFVTSENTNELNISIQTTDKEIDIQLEEYPSATTYEPYRTTILRLPNEVALRSLPNDICDVFNFETKDLTKRIGKVVLDGSSDEKWTYIGKTQTNHPFFEIYDKTNDAYLDESLLGNIICDKLTSTHEEGIAYGNAICGASIVGARQLRLRTKETCEETISTVESFRTWLSQNPITVYYQ